MNFRMSALLAGSSLLAIASISGAHAAPTGAPSQQIAAADETGTEEIVVTARRKSENLQDVPETVSAVTSAELQKLNLQSLQDLSGVVPGLNIVHGGAGFNDANTLRGLSFNPVSGTQNSTAFYMNDAFVTNNMVTVANYDYGQIEVLRGPQGTLRGESAPTGSVTITTHKPDLEKFGGYATGTLTHFGNVNVNGAANVPIVEDKLAIRIAGLIDHNDYNQIKSIHNSAGPYAHTASGRASIRFEPNDDISANVMYQHLYYTQQSYQDVQGTGAPGGVNPNAPAGYDGPPITGAQQLSVDYVPNEQAIKQDIVTGQFDWRFHGQDLNYNASWWRYGLNPTQAPSGLLQAPGITPANPIPGSSLPYSTQTTYNQELRISSTEPDRFWDYTAGVYYHHDTSQVDVINTVAFFPGTFGSPAGGAAATSPFTFNPNYRFYYDIHSPKTEKEFSAYAHVTFHLPDNTELTAGGRWIDYRAVGSISGNTYPTLLGVALPAAAAGLCAAGTTLPGLGAVGPGVYGGTYPGVCDFTKGPSVILPFTPQNLKGNPWVYEASLSHKFNENILVYGNSGSAWRPPASTVGLVNGANDPTLLALQHLKAEKSYNFEAGIKTTFLDNRANLNVSYYHQIYDNLVYEGLSTFYAAYNGVSTTLSQFAFNSSPNAVVDGVDVDGRLQLTHNWNVSAAASYSNGHLTGSAVPCNPPAPVSLASFGPNGQPPFVFLCPSHASTSIAPKFTTSAQTEYTHPINSDIDGFIRGLIVFNGRNPNANIGYTIPSYQITSIYLGIRSPDGAWEAEAFVKNAFDTHKIITQNSFLAPINSDNLATTFGPSGYYTGPGYTAPQEFGITVTYAFGSR